MISKKLKSVLFLMPFCVSVYGVNYHQTHPEAFRAISLNEAAMALYGKDKFATIKQTLNMELIVPKGLVENEQKIPVRISTNIPAKSVAVFFDGNKRPLVAVFHKESFGKTDYEIEIKAERKGTLFAVIESMNGVLYYKRAFVEVVCLPCMAN